MRMYNTMFQKALHADRLPKDAGAVLEEMIARFKDITILNSRFV